MKSIKCFITANRITINGVIREIDPPLSVEEFSDEIYLLCNRSEELNEQWIKEIGGKLFQRVFSEAALEQYRSTDPVALALVLSDDLMSLPWELLHDGTDWIARTRGIVRAAITEQKAPDILPKPGALRVLAAIAGPLLYDNSALYGDNPEQPDPIDVDAHADVFRSLEGVDFPAEIKLRTHVTGEALSREVSENYHILHFIGHSNSGRFVLETRHGVSDLAEANWIGEQITVALRGGLRLVVINSCSSANARMDAGTLTPTLPADEVSGIAATIMETGVPAVIAIQGDLSEHADIAFTRNLYDGLSRGKPIDQAMMDARHAMAADWQAAAWEWSAPVLFINNSLLEQEAPLSLIDANMVKMMADPKVRIVEPPQASLDPMMTREEKFAGRRRELSEVLRSLDPESQDGVQIACLHGDAGMGKTAIAIEAIRRMAEWFDRVIWLSGYADPPDELRAPIADDSPLTRIGGAEAILTALANKCEVELDGSEKPDQQRNSILRSLNDGRRRLLVLDNMDESASSDPVISLIFNIPANCKVLITSREPLDIDGNQTHVGSMNSQDSARLITAYTEPTQLQASPEQLGEIIHFTGGHPMTMRLVVSQVTSYEKTFDGALEDLREAEGKILDHVFNSSLELAGNDGRRLFAAMSVFWPTTGRKALQSVCGLDQGEFEEAAKRVVELSLVESYEQGKRFALHQTARASAQQQLDSGGASEKYRERSARFFMEFVNATAPMARPEIAAKALGVPMLEGRSAQRIQDAAVEIFVKPAIRMMEAELPNCLLALEWALDSKDVDAASRLLSNLSDFLINSGYWDAAIYYYRRTCKGWHEQDEYHAEAFSLRSLGLIYGRQGKWKDAEECYKSVIKTARESEDKELEAHTLNDLGMVYGQQGKWDEASEYLDKAREIFQNLGDEEKEAGISSKLGIFYRNTGRLEEAIQSLQHSLEISGRRGDKQGEADALISLGESYRIGQQYDDAVKCLETALKIYEDLSDKPEMGSVLSNLGLLYEEQGDPDRAMQFYQASLDIRLQLGDRAGQRSVLDNVALVHSKQNQWMEAASASLESFQIAVQTQSTSVIDSLRSVLQISKNMLSSGEFAIPAQLAQQLSQIIQSTEVAENEMRAALAISHGILTMIGFMAACEFDRKSNVYKEALELARTLDGKTGSALKLVEWLEG